jgi:hypothetical protein
MCFNANIGVNEQDNKSKNSNNETELARNSYSDILEDLEEVLYTDWSMDVFEYHNVRVLFEDVGKNL